jgi:hypothetical protein
MSLLVRILLVLLGCGAFAVSRVLIVQNDRSSSDAWALSSLSGGIKFSKPPIAAQHAERLGGIHAVLAGLRGQREGGALQALRENFKRALRPSSGRRVGEPVRLPGRLMMQRMVRQLRGERGRGAARTAEQAALEDQYRMLAQQLEQEGEKVLGQEAWR